MLYISGYYSRGSLLLFFSFFFSGNEYFDRPESRLAFVNNKNVDLKTGLSKLSLLNDGDSNKVNSFCNDKMEDDENFEGACGGEDPKDEKVCLYVNNIKTI